MSGYQINNYEIGIYKLFTIPSITLVKVDNRFISMPKVMKVVSNLTFPSYPSNESLLSSGHSRDNSCE